MELCGKKIKITYVSNKTQRFVKGTVLEEREDFLIISGHRDGKKFWINRAGILEIRELEGGKK